MRVAPAADQGVGVDRGRVADRDAAEVVAVACMGVFNPLFATHRLERVPADRVARVLTAWTVTSTAGIAAVTAVWGVLAAVVGTRTAIAAAAVLLLTTPFLLRRRSPSAPEGPGMRGDEARGTVESCPDIRL